MDRAKFSSTRIGAGSKIDNQVQIGHNVEIGQGAILAGKVGISDHTVLGNQVVVASCSCVSGVIPDKAQLAGVYAFDVKDWRRSQIAVRRLPRMLEQVKELSRRVAEIEAASRGTQDK